LKRVTGKGHIDVYNICSYNFITCHRFVVDDHEFLRIFYVNHSQRQETTYAIGPLIIKFVLNYSS